MEHARPADDTHGTPELHKLVLGVVHAISIGIALDVAEVADVADGAVRAAMVVAEWVIVLASSDTSLSQVPELVNMESM